jgi:hypothetical protein
MAAVRYACPDRGQNPDGRAGALKAADCGNGAVEHASGMLARRPALDVLAVHRVVPAVQGAAGVGIYVTKDPSSGLYQRSTAA